MTRMEPPPPPSLFSGSTRKQNVACDACRAKKIRCQRVTTTQRCGQCAAKDLECTSNYIEQLQSKPRRPRRFKSAEERKSDDGSPPGSAGGSAGASGSAVSLASGSASTSANSVSASANGSAIWIPKKRDAAALQADLLRYLFCPVPVLHQDWRYSDVWGMDAGDIWEGGVWDETPSAAHLAFWAESELETVGVELIDSFFTIVDPRLPILDAHQFLARFQSPTTDPRGPLPHGLLAVVLAFGARFIDHPVFRADRDECTARDANGPPRSRLVQLLVVRAREVAEMNKVFRVPALANAQTLILLEALMCQSVAKGYSACHLGMAARQLDQLRDEGFMQVTAETDEKTRTQLALYIFSSAESALFRLRPEWDGGGVENMVDSGLDDLWLMAARMGAGVVKRLSAELWLPRVKANGIPLHILRDFVADHSAWRDLYLGKLGMPASFTDLDFGATMTAATTDILFHGMWLVAERAVRDFGIKGEPFELQQLKELLTQEALHSAMRITMLTALMAEQGLLRLDPVVLYRPIYDAGMFLARRGQDESLACIAGLRQYATAYPQVWALAADIERTLALSTLAAEPLGGALLI